MNEYAIRYYLFLEHALKINAQLQIQNINAIMIPHMNKTDRTKLINSYKNLIQEREPVDEETVKRDRERFNIFLKSVKAKR